VPGGESDGRRWRGDGGAPGVANCQFSQFTRFKLGHVTWFDPRCSSRSWQSVQSVLVAVLNWFVRLGGLNYLTAWEGFRLTTSFRPSLDIPIGRRSQTTNSQGTMEVTETARTLCEPSVDLGTDPLHWWQLNEHRFPSVARMARDYMGS
jgi:hypothetical protein